MAFVQVVDADGKPGARLDITADEVSIGRASSNSFPIEDPAVSTHHCLIRRQGQRYTLADLNSTNGTLLNGEPVREARLKPKDIITVGSVDILFDGPDIEVEAVSPAGGAVPTPTVRTAPSVRLEVPPAFDRRRSARAVWLAVGIVVMAGLAYLIYRFVSSLWGQ